MTLPTVGSSYNTYGTELNAHINVGHDADGTHKKSQMLTDMGWSPTAYAGGESVTLPNGLIIKSGLATYSASTQTVTFGTAFPTACVSLTVTRVRVATNDSDVNVGNVTETSFVLYNGVSSSVYWQAIGY